MSRPLRPKFWSGQYHITARGNARTDILLCGFGVRLEFSEQTSARFKNLTPYAFERSKSFSATRMLK